LQRAIDRHIDLRPIREQLRPLYSEIGRPSIDPSSAARLVDRVPLRHYERATVTRLSRQEWSVYQ